MSKKIAHCMVHGSLNGGRAMCSEIGVGTNACHSSADCQYQIPVPVEAQAVTVPKVDLGPLAPDMLDVLLRARDAIEALDGTTVENEQLVDDYRAVIAKIQGHHTEQGQKP